MQNENSSWSWRVRGRRHKAAAEDGAVTTAVCIFTKRKIYRLIVSCKYCRLSLLLPKWGIAKWLDFNVLLVKIIFNKVVPRKSIRVLEIDAVRKWRPSHVTELGLFEPAKAINILLKTKVHLCWSVKVTVALNKVRRGFPKALTPCYRVCNFAIQWTSG